MSKKIRSSIERLTIDLCDAILDEIENETGKRPKITSDSIVSRINGEKSGMRPIKSPSSNNSSKICLSTKINGEPCILKATKEGDWKYCGKHKSNLDDKKDTNESHKSKKTSSSDLQSNSSSSDSSSSKSSKKKKNKRNASESQRKATQDKTKNNSLSSSSEKEKEKSSESQKTSKKKAEQAGREQSSSSKKKNSLSSSSSSSSSSEKKNKLKSNKTQKSNSTKVQYKENSRQNIDLEPFGNYFKIAGTSFIIFNKDNKLETVGVEKKEEDSNLISISIKQLSASDRKTIMTVYPTVTIPPDTRMKELTDLFSLTSSVEEKKPSLKQQSEDEIKVNTSKQNESESQVEHSKSSNRNEKSENGTPCHSSADSKSEIVKKDTQSLPEKIVIDKKRSKKNDSSSSSSSSLSNDEKKKKKKAKTNKSQNKDSSSESS